LRPIFLSLSGGKHHLERSDLIHEGIATSEVPSFLVLLSERSDLIHEGIATAIPACYISPSYRTKRPDSRRDCDASVLAHLLKGQRTKRPDSRRDCDPLPYLIFKEQFMNERSDLIHEGIATAEITTAVYVNPKIERSDLIHEGIATPRWRKFSPAPANEAT